MKWYETAAEREERVTSEVEAAIGRVMTAFWSGLGLGLALGAVGIWAVLSG